MSANKKKNYLSNKKQWSEFQLTTVCRAAQIHLGVCLLCTVIISALVILPPLLLLHNTNIEALGRGLKHLWKHL